MNSTQLKVQCPARSQILALASWQNQTHLFSNCDIRKGLEFKGYYITMGEKQENTIRFESYWHQYFIAALANICIDSMPSDATRMQSSWLARSGELASKPYSIP